MKSILGVFSKILKKHGFTLAEALIVTVMAGYCILPILGTMQNASVKAEAYDHYSKMLQYTRSRLTKEIANAAFDHRTVSTETKYHYVVYFDKSGVEENATRIEVPETSVTPEDLKCINTNRPSGSYPSEEACNLFGLKNTSSSSMISAYLRVVYAYKTTVQIKDHIDLEQCIQSVTSSDKIDSPKGLMGIVVTTRLIEDDGDEYDDNGKLYTNKDSETVDENVNVCAAPVSNFSLVNLPTVSDEYIWVADSLNMKLYGIDPLSKTIAANIVLERASGGKNLNKPDHDDHNPFRPWRIALHPSGKIMVVLMKNNIMMVNLDKKSPDYGAWKKLLSPSSSSDFCTSGKTAEKSIEDGGVAFRPDGKYFFLTKKDAKQLLGFKLDYEIDSSTKALKWSTVNAQQVATAALVLDDDKNKYVGLVASSNGYLYLAYKDKDLGVYRTSMYPPNDDFVTQWSNPAKIGDLSYGKDLMGIAVSPAGNILAVVLDDKDASADNVLIFDANTGAVIGKKKYDDVCRPAFVANANASNSINDRTLTVNVTNRKGKDNVSATSLAIGNDRLVEYGSYKTMAGGSGGGSAANKYIAYQEVIPSPIPGELVLTEKDKPHLVFIKSNTKADAETIITADKKLELATGKGPKADNSISDIAAIPRDILAVSSSGTITLYDMNVMKRIEDNQIIATDTPTELSMSPNGEMVIGSYGSKRSGATPFYLSDYSSGPDLSVGTGEIKKHVFDDRSQNMLFFLKEDNSGTTTASSTAVYNMNKDFAANGDWACSTDSVYFRGDFKLSNEWERLDMIGLPKGGYMALFGKSDGTSMLEWVGRIPREYPVNANKYSLFARWVSQPSNLGQRIVPDYTPDSFSEDAVDSNTGFIAVETSKQFQVNDVVKFCDVRAGSWSGGETRYITPVLVSGTTNDGYTIKDWTTTSIGLNSGEVKNNVKLIWANGGKIVNNTYFIGFWNGGKSGSGTGNPGVVALAIGNKNYSFYSDCGKDNPSSPVSLGSGDIKVDTQLYNHPSAKDGSNYSSGGTTLVANWRRKYAINFKTEGNSNSSSFPPSHSKKLAVTYDMGTLAVLSGEDTAGGATPTVSLYDFNSSNFLNETQIEGMLIDYREKMQTGAYDEINSKVKSPDYPWPEEQESLFKKVANNCGFGASTMASFQTMSTKYDSFKAFNKHPGNFHIDDSDSISGLDGIKAKANKRFFGYIRDDKDFTLLQGIPSEDSRFFYENILLGGRVETGNNDKLYDSAFSIGLEPYQSGLLQFDQTSNGGGSWSAIFLGKNGATDAKISSSNLSSASGNDISKNNILTKEYDVCGWNTLKSSQTYILKHQPTLMKAFPARTSEPKVLGVDSASMMFSRDRANPVLYISDKTNNCVWAIGRDASNNYKLVRFNLGSINLTGAMAISSDGTKLFVGCSAEATTSTGGTGTKASAKKNEIRVYNIAKPDTSVFDVSSLVKDLSTAPSPNAATYTAYLGTMSADGSPVAMAAMPFVNYSTAGAVGDYTEISNQTLKEIPVAYNGCMTIASGGLYIFPATTDNSSTTIWLFNPLESRVSKFKNVLKAPAPYSPITSYDDTLYVMGDDADGSKPTNRVQSYSVNERKAKTSIIEEPDVFNDSYMVNSVYKSDETNQLMIIRTGSEAIIDGDDPKDVFDDNMDSYWRSSTTSSSNQERWVSYSFPDSNKVTVNSAVVYNRANVNTNRLEDWELYGEDSVPNNKSELTYDPAKKLMSGVCGFDVYGPYLPNSITPKGAHSTFVLYAKSAKDGGKQRGVSNLELWRTGVKRLLPVIGSISVVDPDNDKGAFQPGEIPSNSPLEGMKWSPAPASSKNLGLADIFANNKGDKKNTLRGYSSSTANDCTQWKNIIEYGGAGQRYKSTANYPWIICKFKKSESVCVVRYANFGNTSGKGGIKKFKLFGSNTTDAAPNTSDGSVPSGWEPITFTNGGEEFTGPGTAEGGTVDAYVYNSYITAEIMNPQPYRYYLMQITGKLKDGFSLAGLEMFSSDSKIGIDGDYLTGLEDDNRTVIQVGKGACCATPYGLVYTGGHVAESGYATNTALLYWPHAIDKYDGTYYKNGISRSLPPLGQARYNHAMVWHKGRLYVLGGAINEDHKLAGSDGGAYAEYLDGISSGAFQWMPIYQREFKPVSSDITVADMLGFYQGVCSYGDEIFIFGGQKQKSTGFSAAAYAWNPETGRVRKLRSLPDPSNRVKFQALSPCSAVVFGSKIYIYGMNNSASPAKPVFFEYTP